MKDNKNIWQDKFSGMKAPLDKDALWNDIADDDRFPKKKKSRRILFFIFFLGMIGGIFIMDFYLNSTDINNEIIGNIIKDEEIESNLKSEENKIIDTSLEEDIKIDAEKNESDFDKLLNRKELKITNDKNYKSSKSNINQEQIRIHTNSNSKWNINIPTRNLTEKNQDYINGIRKQSNKFPEVKTQTQIEPKTDENNNEKLDGKPVALDAPVEEATVLNNENILLAELIPNDIELLGNEKFEEIWEINKDEKWTISLGTGIGYSVFSYNYQAENVIDSVSQINESDISQWKKHTRSIASFRHSLQVERKLKKDWLVGIGVQYLSLNQRFNYRETEEGDIDIFLDTLGGISVTQLLIHTDYELFHNYKELDVNLFFGKNISFRKMDLFAKAGLSFNTYFKSKGKYLDSTLSLKGINEDSDYKKRLGISYFAELGIKQPIHQNISWFTSFSYQSPIRMTNKKSTLNQRSNSFFLNLGLKFDL